MPLAVSLAYMFLYLEVAQNRILRFGVVKLHKANSRKADEVINKHHITRGGFLDLYKNIFGQELGDSVNQLVKRAEKIRDKVIHGKAVQDREIREAIFDVLCYAEALNSDVNDKAQFEPFADLRGFVGARGSLDEKTTHWLLRGIGFDSKRIEDVTI